MLVSYLVSFSIVKMEEIIIPLKRQGFFLIHTHSCENLRFNRFSLHRTKRMEEKSQVITEETVDDVGSYQ